MNIETLKKEFIQFKYNKYRQTMQEREASIATKFALDDMMNQYNQNRKNISKEYALAVFNDELNYYQGK